MTERQMQLRIGALVLAGILLFVGFVLAIGRRSALFEERYSLWTSFASTEGLGVGASVRLAGVPIGTVTRITFGRDPRDRGIIIWLSLERRVQERIREDSVASIGTIGLLGDKVLDVTVGSADKPPLRAGGRLASMAPVDYGQLLQKGEQILSHVNRITAELDEFVAGGAQTGGRTLNDALRSLRATLVEVERGQGVLHEMIYGKQGAGTLVTLDQTAKRLDRLVAEVEQGRGLLHGLIYTPEAENLGRLARAAESLEALLRQAQDGPGLLHTLLYDRQGPDMLARLDRTSERLEQLATSLQEGDGLLPALLFDPKRKEILTDLQTAAAGIRQAAADIQRLTDRVAAGQGTLGALIEDPTVYEDLSALLRGAERSVLLRGIIRGAREKGEPR